MLPPRLHCPLTTDRDNPLPSHSRTPASPRAQQTGHPSPEHSQPTADPRGEVEGEEGRKKCKRRFGLVRGKVRERRLGRGGEGEGGR